MCCEEDVTRQIEYVPHAKVVSAEMTLSFTLMEGNAISSLQKPCYREDSQRQGDERIGYRKTQQID